MPSLALGTVCALPSASQTVLLQRSSTPLRRRAWRDEDCPQDAEDAEKQTENKACAEAALFSVCDGPRDCATPNQDNHQSR
jgi:hypothetical protein